MHLSTKERETYEEQYGIAKSIALEVDQRKSRRV